MALLYLCPMNTSRTTTHRVLGVTAEMTAADMRQLADEADAKGLTGAAKFYRDEADLKDHNDRQIARLRVAMGHGG